MELESLRERKEELQSDRQVWVSRTSSRTFGQTCWHLLMVLGVCSIAASARVGCTREHAADGRQLFGSDGVQLYIKTGGRVHVFMPCLDMPLC